MSLEVIEPIINGFKIKYSMMSDMIHISELEGRKTNVFINIDSILSKFFRSDEVISAFNSLEDNVILTSELINIIAHYRHFFWSRYRMPITFYLYHCNKQPKWQKKYVPNYNIKTLDKIQDKENPKYGGLPEAIEQNLRLVKLLSTYVDKAYYIESDGLEPSVIPYYVSTLGCKDTCNIIITQDKSEYQLVNLDNTVVFHPRGNKSKIITKKNIFDEAVFGDIKYKPNNELDPNLYSLYIALTGDKNRNLIRVDGFSKVKSLKLIDRLIDMKYINNGINKGLDKILLMEFLSESQYKQLKNNYKCINFNFAYKLLRDVDKVKINNCFVDKYDNKAIMEINSKYFEYNHIRLIELCEGTSIY